MCLIYQIKNFSFYATLNSFFSSKIKSLNASFMQFLSFLNIAYDCLIFVLYLNMGIFILLSIIIHCKRFKKSSLISMLIESYIFSLRKNIFS